MANYPTFPQGGTFEVVIRFGGTVDPALSFEGEFSRSDWDEDEDVRAALR